MVDTTINRDCWRTDFCDTTNTHTAPCLLVLGYRKKERKQLEALQEASIKQE